MTFDDLMFCLKTAKTNCNLLKFEFAIKSSLSREAELAADLVTALKVHIFQGGRARRQLISEFSDSVGVRWLGRAKCEPLVHSFRSCGHSLRPQDEVQEGATALARPVHPGAILEATQR